MFPEISMIRKLTKQQKTVNQEEMTKETIKEINEKILSTANAGLNRIEYFCNNDLSIIKIFDIIKTLADEGYTVHRDSDRGYHKLYISW